MTLRQVLSATCLLLATATLAGPASQPASRPTAPVVVVFDFASAGELGAQLADSVRLRLARDKAFEVIDQLTTKDASGPLAADADRAKAVELMTRQLDANIAIYGTVTKHGDTMKADVRCVDLRMPGEPTGWSKEFSDDTQRARGLLARQIVEALTGQVAWKPPEYGDEPEPKQFGKPLNVNGDFDAGSQGWDRPDNVSTFLVDEKGRGKVLRINTALERDAWLEYRRALMFGKADPDKPPKIAHDESYNSVAGLEGVHYKSAWIKATPGQRYWLTADVKGGGGAKIFVKGFFDATAAADGISETALTKLGLTPQQFAAMDEAQRKKLIEADAKANPERYRRECYRWFLNCGGSGGKWAHFAAPVPPRGGLPDNVKWLQIQVYAYWPPGDYYFDNVMLYADPAQKAPLPEEKPQTPNWAKERGTATAAE